MGELSSNFSEHEFRRRCGRAEINTALVEALQELRYLASRPVRITSGYHCPDHNRSKDSKRRSQYLLVNAINIVIDGLTPIEMYCLLIWNSYSFPKSFRDGLCRWTDD